MGTSTRPASQLGLRWDFPCPLRFALRLFRMKHPFKPFLDDFGVVILDGAMATELERRGADLEDSLWSAKVLLESPELIREVHFDYFAAGADVAITASYQATFQGLAQRGLSHGEAADLIRLSVQLAREARDAFWEEPAHRQGRLRPLIAGSVGCYGAYLADGSEYRGNYGLSRGELLEFHRGRLEVLVEAGVDLLVCETIPCKVEAEALVELLREFPETPAWLSFSCRDEEHVCEGDRLADCAAVAEDCENVVAVGINCTAPRFIAGLLRALAPVTEKTLVVYPNSGESWDAEVRQWLENKEEANFADVVKVWYGLGARAIGGCCRTTPEMIRELAAALRAEASIDDGR